MMGMPRLGRMSRGIRARAIVPARTTAMTTTITLIGRRMAARERVIGFHSPWGLGPVPPRPSLCHPDLTVLRRLGGENNAERAPLALFTRHFDLSPVGLDCP